MAGAHTGRSVRASGNCGHDDVTDLVTAGARTTGSARACGEGGGDDFVDFLMAEACIERNARKSGGVDEDDINGLGTAGWAKQGVCAGPGKSKQ